MKFNLALLTSACAYEIQPIGDADPIRLSVKEYPDADSVTYVFPVNPDATEFDVTYEIMENEQHQVTLGEQLGLSGNEFTISLSAGQVFKNLAVVEKNATGNAISSYGEGMGRTGGAGAYVTDVYAENDSFGEHVLIMEGRLLNDMSSGDCFQEANFTFPCSPLGPPELFHGSENATVTFWDAAANTMSMITTQAFDSAYVKFQARFNMTTDCAAYVNTTDYVGREDTTFMTIGASNDMTEAAAPVTLLVQEVAGSRYEKFPDTSRPVVIAGEHADEDDVLHLNATMVVYSAEIPVSTDKVTCLPELTITFDGACAMNEITLYGMSDSTMALGAGASHTTTLANMDMNQVAIVVVFNGDSVEGACDAAAQMPEIVMNYNKVV